MNPDQWLKANRAAYTEALRAKLAKVLADRKRGPHLGEHLLNIRYDLYDQDLEWCLMDDLGLPGEIQEAMGGEIGGGLPQEILLATLRDLGLTEEQIVTATEA